MLRESSKNQFGRPKQMSTKKIENPPPPPRENSRSAPELKWTVHDETRFKALPGEGLRFMFRSRLVKNTCQSSAKNP